MTCAALSAEEPTPSVAAQLQAQSDRNAAARVAALDDYIKRIGMVKAWYVGQIDTMLKDSTSRGDLEGVLAAKNEKERTDRPLTPEERRGLPAAFSALRARYDQAIAQLAANQKTAEVASLRQYLGALEILQKNLTQKGDLDGGLMVKNARTVVAEQLASIETAGSPPASGTMPESLAAGSPAATPVTGVLASVPSKAGPSSGRESNLLGARKFLVKMRIDGIDRILFRDGKLWVEHMGFNKPDSFSVNGAPWEPVWNGDTTEPFVDFHPSLAPANPANVTFSKVAGRSGAKFISQDSAKKGAATIFIHDQPNGAGIYEFELSW